MHEVYRAYDTDDTLLYIGVTCNLRQRQMAHRSKSAWCHGDVIFKGSRAKTDNRWHAEMVEARAIRRFKPPHNKKIISVPSGTVLRIGEGIARETAKLEALLEGMTPEQQQAQINAWCKPFDAKAQEALKLLDLPMPKNLPKPKKRKAK